MFERFTGAKSIRIAERRLRTLINDHGEWLCSRGPERPAMLLQRSECDFQASHGRLKFSCWGEEGAVVWRVTGWEWTGERILLEASRRMGAETSRLVLIPRASVEATTAAISDSRRARCYRLAHLACATLHAGRIERVGLSVGPRRGQPGRYARILLRDADRKRIAVAGVAAEPERHDVDAFLSAALIWFTRASERARSPYIRRLWLIVEKDCVGALAQMVALLRGELRRVISMYQLDDEWQQLIPLRSPRMDDLWMEKPQRFRLPATNTPSESAAMISAHAPDAIDVVRSRHGETLRYHGLPFARVRRSMDRERVWFGLDGARRRLLDDGTQREWMKLLRDLEQYRSVGAADPRHALYRASPEAWLESELRRDITRLDPGLRLAPLYAQFRPSHAGGSRPIDLLALRRDGRLVVIELKVAEEREHVLQGADYWRRTEIHRRHGHITRARLFGDADISDESPLVYLVAPMLRFHRSFPLLARAISPQVEIYRFDINEDWRGGVRVMRRMRAN